MQKQVRFDLSGKRGGGKRETREIRSFDYVCSKFRRACAINFDNQPKTYKRKDRWTIAQEKFAERATFYEIFFVVSRQQEEDIRSRWKLRSIKHASLYFCLSLNNCQKNFYCDTMRYSKRNLSALCTGWMLADGAFRFIYRHRIGLTAWQARPHYPYLIPYYPSWKEKKWKKKRIRDPVRGRFPRLTRSRLERVTWPLKHNRSFRAGRAAI